MAFVRHNNNNNGRRHNPNHNNNRHRQYNNNGNSGQQSSSGNNQQRRFVNRINQVFDSNGPDGRIRGTVQQIFEKYTNLARDTSAHSDRVLMLNYLQHAEHYQRLLNEILEENAVNEREREATRVQQGAQPEMGAETVSSPENAGDTPRPAMTGETIDAAPVQSELAAPSPQQRPQREHHQQRNRQVPVRRTQDDAISDEDNALPSFLQMPAPKPQATVAAQAAPPVAEEADVVRPARAPRTRRVPAARPAEDGVVSNDSPLENL